MSKKVLRKNKTPPTLPGKPWATEGIFRLALAFSAIVFFLIILEMIARLAYPHVAPRTGRIAVDIMRGQEDAFAHQLVRPHPQLFYENTPGFEGAGLRQINSRGYRGDEFNVLPPPGTVRILALGGSTTFGYLLRNPHDAWPAQLESMLNQNGAMRYEVINAGVLDATSAELLARYMFRDRYLQPDIVLIHTGGNDAPALFFPDYHPEYTHYRMGWTQSLMALRAGEKLLLKSALMRVLYAWWLRVVPMPIMRSDHWWDLHPDEARQHALKQSPTGFQRNMDLLIRTILADGATPILIPFIKASEQKVRSAWEDAGISPDFYEAMAVAVQKSNGVMANMAETHHVAFLPLSSFTIPDAYFFDACHLDPRGEHIKASIILEAVKNLRQAPP